MNRSYGRKLELVCILCNESLADLEKACSGLQSGRSEFNSNNNNPITSQHPDEARGDSLANDGNDYGGKGVSQHYGGYHSMSTENQKEVVATKCGHMFHQGCLRKHVHKTLIEGKGGALFCPICTRPFQMNRLWPVVIPPTKAQRERFLQLKMMKEQNCDMVKQLKQIRANIAEEEATLKKLKDDAEQCLNDIQQKQKLLDSVNGPTNKEMIELTKVHMKRQEILHVVTQHNADLLKLLAEESNISSSTAENMFSKPNMDGNEPDMNQNFIPRSDSSRSRSRSRSRSKSRSRADSKGDVGICAIPSNSIISSYSGPSPRKLKSKKEKGTNNKKKTKKVKSKKPKAKQAEPEIGDFPIPNDLDLPIPFPTKLASNEAIPWLSNNPRNQGDILRQIECGTADTLAKWNIESLKELMSFSNSFSEVGEPPERQKLPPPPMYALEKKQSARKLLNNNKCEGIWKTRASAKDSIHMLLARKPNMAESFGTIQ